MDWKTVTICLKVVSITHHAHCDNQTSTTPCLAKYAKFKKAKNARATSSNWFFEKHYKFELKAQEQNRKHIKCSSNKLWFTIEDIPGSSYKLKNTTEGIKMPERQALMEDWRHFRFELQAQEHNRRHKMPEQQALMQN